MNVKAIEALIEKHEDLFNKYLIMDSHQLASYESAILAELRVRLRIAQIIDLSEQDKAL